MCTSRSGIPHIHTHAHKHPILFSWLIFLSISGLESGRQKGIHYGFTAAGLLLVLASLQQNCTKKDVLQIKLFCQLINCIKCAEKQQVYYKYHM